jgi:hypothetical protein
MMDFDQVEQTIEEGYISVKEKIEQIKFLLEPASTSHKLDLV